jgi:hypothetical protein
MYDVEKLKKLAFPRRPTRHNAQDVGTSTESYINYEATPAGIVLPKCSLSRAAKLLPGSVNACATSYQACGSAARSVWQGLEALKGGEAKGPCGTSWPP